MGMRRPLFALTLLTASLGTLHPAAGAIALPEFTAQYDLGAAGLGLGRATVSLTRQGPELRYQSISQPVGALALVLKQQVIEESVARVEGSRLVPLRYEYRHEGSDKNRDVSYRYDWDRRVAHVDVRGKRADIRVAPGTLDPNVLRLALMRDVSSPKTSYAYPVLNRGKLRTYRFAELGTEPVQTPLGRYQTVKLQRVDGGKSDDSFTVWCAPDLHYLPVKIEKVEEGRLVMNMELRSVQWH